MSNYTQVNSNIPRIARLLMWGAGILILVMMVLPFMRVVGGCAPRSKVAAKAASHQARHVAKAPGSSRIGKVGRP